jgi:hypothetical protein
MSRVTGFERYRSRLRKALVADYPNATADQRDEIIERAAKLSGFLADTVCKLSIRDMVGYEGDRMTAPVVFSLMTHILGYCEKHGMVHEYERAALYTVVKVDIQEMLDQVKALDESATMSHVLYELLLNRPLGLANSMVARHMHEWGIARNIAKARQKHALSGIFDSMDVEEQINYFFCGRKTPHETREAAEAVLRVEKNGSAKNRSLVVYKCTHCANYHLGHGEKLRDYSHHSTRQLAQLAADTWHVFDKKSRQYAERHGLLPDVSVTHDEVLAVSNKSL